MLRKFNDEQLNLINQILDFAFWSKKFKDCPADVAFVKEVCAETKIA
jgi:hypothetical protein